MLGFTSGFPVRLSTLLLLLVGAAAQAQVATAPRESEDVLRSLTPAEEARYLAAREARATGSPSGDGVLAGKLDQDSRQSVVPRYRVDATSASGTTTLFAVRNTQSTATSVLIAYLSDLGTIQQTETFDLAPRQVLTRNVRDVAGLASGMDGFKTGFIIVTGPAESLLSVDTFQVDPGNDFATGSRAVDAIGTYLCDLWDIRYLAGGIFSGGTNLNLLINGPQGTGSGSDPSVVFLVTNESGMAAPGLVGLFTPRVTTTVAASDVLAAVGAGAAPFGAFEVDFTNANGGLVEAVYDADGRFSIGLKGSCVTP